MVWSNLPWTQITVGAQSWMGTVAREGGLLRSRDTCTTHKRPQDNGSFQSAPILSGKPSDQDSSGSDGQHGHSILSELDGTDQVPVSLMWK